VPTIDWKLDFEQLKSNWFHDSCKAQVPFQACKCVDVERGC